VEIPSSIQSLLPKPWQELSDSEKRFTAALIAYAAGDAFGAFYEFSEIVSDIPNELREKEDWPFGGTSDDTSLTILTLLTLTADSPEGAAQSFIHLLRANRDILRGLGPTTRSALGMQVQEREVNSIGFTNGAMMRTALLGLILNDESERNSWVRALASTTHRLYAVETSVSLASAFALGSLEGTSSWDGNNRGVSNDALDTLKAIGHVVQHSDSPFDAMRVSCSMGGDTDTVSALSAGLISLRTGGLEKVFQIPWLEKVDWNGISGFTEALKVVFLRLAKL
jgi:ADP-ribosylglycohydrolase